MTSILKIIIMKQTYKISLVNISTSINNTTVIIELFEVLEYRVELELVNKSQCRELVHNTPVFSEKNILMILKPEIDVYP